MCEINRRITTYERRGFLEVELEYSLLVWDELNTIIKKKGLKPK